MRERQEESQRNVFSVEDAKGEETKFELLWGFRYSAKPDTTYLRCVGLVYVASKDIPADSKIRVKE
jgi:hypothetical protein